VALAGALLAVGALLGVERARQGAPLPPTPSLPSSPEAVFAATAAAPVASAWSAPEDPRDAGLAGEPLARAVRGLRAEVERGAFPGAALAVGRGPDLALQAGVGGVRWNGDAVDPDATVYDVASLTKVVATTTAAMLLVEDGKLDLDAPVSRYLPRWLSGAGSGKGADGSRDRVLVRHLLTHTSGLPAGAATRGTSEEVRARLVSTPLKARPGTKVEYSDVGFVVLWAVAERAAGIPLPELLRTRVFDPLGMTSTTFHPQPACDACAPTLRLADGSEIHGRVHDPIAAKLGGDHAGNAGLFSTVRDLGRFAAMLANGGELGGVRVLKEETVREFTRRQVGAGTRALGWDTRNERGVGAAGLAMSPGAFGHTGFTGTSLWVDPERGTWTVLLTNRTYEPRSRVAIQEIRRTVHDDVVRAADAVAMAD